MNIANLTSVIKLVSASATGATTAAATQKEEATNDSKSKAGKKSGTKAGEEVAPSDEKARNGTRTNKLSASAIAQAVTKPAKANEEKPSSETWKDAGASSGKTGNPELSSGTNGQSRMQNLLSDSKGLADSTRSDGEALKRNYGIDTVPSADKAGTTGSSLAANTGNGGVPGANAGGVNNGVIDQSQNINIGNTIQSNNGNVIGNGSGGNVGITTEPMIGNNQSALNDFKFVDDHPDSQPYNVGNPPDDASPK